MKENENENTNIKKMISNLVESDYIKESWFDKETIINLFNTDSIIDCIKKCTSPRASKKNNPITEDDLKLIFKAFSLFKPSETRVLILGQDPYPEKEKAHGLAFSFKKNQEPDDSLLNIFKAIEKYKKENNIKITKPIKEWNTNLETWAENNKILLLNTALTFESKGNPHFKYWNDFIKNIIKILVQTKLDNNCNNKLAIFLWGEKAQKIFFKSFNETDNNYEIDFQKVQNPINDVEPITINKKFYTNKPVIQGKITIGNNFEIYLTYHPSNRYKKGKEQFLNDAPVHFKACDEFLEKPIFKDFSENNTEDYYKNKK